MSVSLYLHKPVCQGIAWVVQVNWFVVGPCQLHTMVVPFDKYVITKLHTMAFASDTDKI